MMDWFPLAALFSGLPPEMHARLSAAVLALAVTALAGLAAAPLAGSANPLLWTLMDRTLGVLGGRLDRRERPSADLMTRGMILTLAGVATAAFAGGGAALLAARYPLMGLTETGFLALSLSGGVAWRALARLAADKDGTDQGGGGGAGGGGRDAAAATAGRAKKPWYVLARSARTDFSAADDYAATRGALGYAARGLDKAVVAPVFWFLLGGLTFCYLYAGLAALAWRFGRDGFGKGFGRPALLLEMIMGFIPHMVTGFLLALAGLFTPRGGMVFRPLVALFSGRRRAPYIEGGLPLTAMAYALGVTLGGPAVDLDGRSLQRAWIGPEKASAQLDPGHLRRGLYLVMVAYLLLILSLAGAMLWGGPVSWGAP